MKTVLWFSLLAALPLCAQVRLKQGSDRILIDIDGKPFTALFIGGDAPKPYLHPLRTASGKIVTRAYPMEMVEGESRDHPHHRGLWFTHGDVNGLDFWANEPSQKSPKKGRVGVKKVLDLKSGKKSGVVSMLFEWVDPDGKTLLTENRPMTFYAHPTLRMIDFDIQLNATGEPVRFGDTKEGTFAIRLATPLEEAKGGKMVSAEGKQGEKNVWGKRSPWVDYTGELEGEKVGIAIFDHPGNPKHPTFWHSRAYGLFAANIFGEKDFFNDKSRDGGLTLEPAKPWRFRYRVIIHPGDTAASGIAEMYTKYSRQS